MEQETIDRTRMLHVLVTERYWRLEMQTYVHQLMCGIAVGFLGTELIDCLFGGWRVVFYICVPLWSFNLTWNLLEWIKTARRKRHQKNLMNNLVRFIKLYESGASEILMLQAISQVDAAMAQAVKAL